MLNDEKSGLNCGFSKSVLMLFIAGLAMAIPARAQALPPTALRLQLAAAIDFGVKNNVRTLLAGQQISEAEGTRGLAFSALLPNLAASAQQANLTANLAAWGLPVSELRGFPVFVGPWSRFDARVSLVQSIFDLGAIRRFQASSKGVAQAEDQQRLSVQQVTTVTILSYLSVLEGEQSLSAARANAQLADRLLELAVSQKDSGVATGVDVARAETRVAQQHVLLAQAETGLDAARLNLLRVIGLPLSTEMILVDRMRFESEGVPDSKSAIERALADRIEIKMADREVEIAETQRKAAIAGWLPTINGFGDYGSSGLKPNETNLPTRSIGVQLNLPIFDGGRVRSEVKVASSRLQQAQTQRADLRAAVEKEVRLALMNLKTRNQQVEAATRAEALAVRELELAQDRFKNGVGDNIEVINAQTALENARQVYVSSLAQYNAARVSLVVAMGHPEDFHF
jgi:outer membrane protein